MQAILPPRWSEPASGGKLWSSGRCRSVPQAEGLSKNAVSPAAHYGPLHNNVQAPSSCLGRACSPAASQAPLTPVLPWCDAADVSEDTPDLPGHSQKVVQALASPLILWRGATDSKVLKKCISGCSSLFSGSGEVADFRAQTLNFASRVYPHSKLPPRNHRESPDCDL